MKSTHKQQIKTSYLDVTQYIIKQCSPLIKPISPTLNFTEQRIQRTPEINPIDHDTSKLIMTPLCNDLCKQPNIDLNDQFVLDSVQPYQFDNKYQKKYKHKNKYQQKQKQLKQNKQIKQKYRRNSIQQFYIYHNEDSLNMILQVQYQENSDINSNQMNQHQYQHQQDQQDSYYSSFYEQNSYYSSIYKKQQQHQKQSTIDQSSIQFYDAIERFKENPKKQIIKYMKQIQNTMPEETEQNKKNIIKKFIEKYLLDYQIYCYEEAWKQLETLHLYQIIKKVSQGLTETFNKKIGLLPFQVRRTKILKYLQKKKKRIWRKKVSYDCRKKVADGRLRIKGKFVTRQQACQQLGVTNLDGYTSQEIKYMLQRRLDQRDL